jgi:glutamate-ammonia-ligase adenylyltransferase
LAVKAKSQPGAAKSETLASRIARAPRLAAPAASRAKVKEWLAEVAGTKAGKSLARLTAEMPKVSALVDGLADGSPYLWELVTNSPARWAALLESDPEARLAELLNQTATAADTWDDDAAAMSALRQMKSEASLLIAVADIGGVWDVPHVTHALTELADTAVGAAVRYLLRKAKKGKPPKQPEIGSGYIVLALGKMGAFELNYSSDIDLIVFYEPEAAPGSDIGPSAHFVRITRGLVKLLQERTGDGYVFRVDLRLRPDPASTQIAVSVPAALDYYESAGQNWERAAMIKARPCAGDIAAGDALMKNLAPFIWRKHLDYAAIAEVHAMKQQIHVYRGHGDIAVEGHNVKLGRGGIREIEFFVQTQQLIAGGRHPELRGRRTLDMLDELAQGQWIKEAAREELEAAYKFLRGVEHRLQMVADEQTHTLPEDREELERFSRFLGYTGRAAFAEDLLRHLNNVQTHYAALFEALPSLPGQAPAMDPAKLAQRPDYLAERGLVKPAEAAATIERWFSGRYRSLKSELARAQLADLVPQFIDRAVRSENPDAALAALDRFLEALHGGAQLYSLLKQNPDLVSLLVTILATAPRLADILAQQPEVMDGVMEPAFFGKLPDEDQLEKALRATFGQSDTFEDYLDRARVFGREHMFLIGVRVISGTVSAAQAGDAFARLAGVLIRAMLEAATTKFIGDHGKLKRQEVALLALGKLGGYEMTAGSDLDLIVIYDFDDKNPESDGKRSLNGAQYFARLTQRVVNSLTVPTNYGKLYDVDMRLRPSGRSGPLATSLRSFEDYQATDAWTWEHMALTRARILAASPAFTTRIEKIIHKVLCRPRPWADIAGDVREMRQAIATERGEDERWNIKDAAGGLLDIEFIAQYLQLVHAAETPEILDTNTVRVLEKATRLGLLSVEDAGVLRPAVRLYQDLTQILRLCLSEPFDPKKAGAGLVRLLTRAADVPDLAALEAHLADTQTAVRETFERMLGDSAEEA